jgi:hypothetical protein
MESYQLIGEQYHPYMESYQLIEQYHPYMESYQLIDLSPVRGQYFILSVIFILYVLIPGPDFRQ